MDICTIARLLTDLPELTAALNYEGLTTYIDLVRLLQPDLSWFGNITTREPPEHLPVAYHDFLKLCLGLEDEIAKLAWTTLQHIAWQSDPDAEASRKLNCARSKYLKLFLEHGTCRGIGA